jgi:hypothetical protein
MEQALNFYCDVRSATGFLLKLMFLNPCTFPAHMVYAVSFKYTRINCPTIKVFLLVTIKLANGILVGFCKHILIWAVYQSCIFL